MARSPRRQQVYPARENPDFQRNRTKGLDGSPPSYARGTFTHPFYVVKSYLSGKITSKFFAVFRGKTPGTGPRGGPRLRGGTPGATGNLSPYSPSYPQVKLALTNAHGILFS